MGWHCLVIICDGVWTSFVVGYYMLFCCCSYDVCFVYLYVCLLSLSYFIVCG